MSWEPLPQSIPTLFPLSSGGRLPDDGHRRHTVLHPQRVRLRPRLPRLPLATRPRDDTTDARAARCPLHLDTRVRSIVARTMTAAERVARAAPPTSRFFLYVDIWDPHEPWNPPDYYTQSLPPDYEGGADLHVPTSNWRAGRFHRRRRRRSAHATYCGEVTMVDRWIGQLALRSSTLLGLARQHRRALPLRPRLLLRRARLTSGRPMGPRPERAAERGRGVPTWFSQSCS